MDYVIYALFMLCIVGWIIYVVGMLLSGIIVAL